MANRPLLHCVRWLGILGTFFFGWLPFWGLFDKSLFNDVTLLSLLIAIASAVAWRVAGQKLKKSDLPCAPLGKSENMTTMPSALRVFLAIAAIIAGVILIANLNLLHDTEFWWNDEWFNDVIGKTIPGSVSWDRVVQAVSGVTLLAAGLTYFWTSSRFHRR